MEILVTGPDPQWPQHYEAVKAELSGDLQDEGVSYLAIEHIGSTSVPDLPAKPIIDVLITVSPSDFNDANLEKFREVLSWGPRQAGYHYIGNGGVNGRWSFKLYGDIEIPRNVYVMPEDGGLVLTSYRLLRQTLTEHEDLRVEYGQIKFELAESEYGTVMQYAAKKRPVIRKILRRAGWTDEMVDAQEAMSVTDWPSEAWKHY